MHKRYLTRFDLKMSFDGYALLQKYVSHGIRFKDEFRRLSYHSKICVPWDSISRWVSTVTNDSSFAKWTYFQHGDLWASIGKKNVIMIRLCMFKWLHDYVTDDLNHSVRVKQYISVPAVGNHGPLEWCHNERDDIWNHRRLDYLLSRLFRRRSKRTTMLRVTGLCEGKSTTWWRHHVTQATNCSHEPSDYQRMKTQSSAFTVLCEGNTRVSSGFSLQRASNMESVSMSWRHHGMEKLGISHDAYSHFLSVGTVLCTIYAYHGQMY